jgi:hypothetical protein
MSCGIIARQARAALARVGRYCGHSRSPISGSELVRAAFSGHKDPEQIVEPQMKR